MIDKAYIKAALLGVVAVMLIDVFLTFSFMQPLFSFMISAEYAIYFEIIFGSVFGASFQYAKAHMPYNKKETKIFSDLRHILVLLVFTIVITYVVVFASYLPIFPLILCMLYHLSLGAFYSLLPASNNKNDILNSFWQLISAPFLGGLVTMIFCYLLKAVFLVSNPILSNLFFLAMIGAVAQSVVTYCLMDFNVSFVTQWTVSCGLFGLCLATLYLSTTPFLPFFIFNATPTLFYFLRYNTNSALLSDSQFPSTDSISLNTDSECSSIKSASDDMVLTSTMGKHPEETNDEQNVGQNKK